MSFVTHDQQVEFLEQQKAHITLTHVLSQDRIHREAERQRKFQQNWQRVMRGEKLR